jgi:hypothetical protein
VSALYNNIVTGFFTNANNDPYHSKQQQQQSKSRGDSASTKTSVQNQTNDHALQTNQPPVPHQQILAHNNPYRQQNQQQQ